MSLLREDRTPSKSDNKIIQGVAYATNKVFKVSIIDLTVCIV